MYHREAKEHLRHDLRLRKEFLGILEDNRVKTQGADDWHFTLKLWSRSTQPNLITFDQEWRSRKSQDFSIQQPAAFSQSPGETTAAQQSSGIVNSQPLGTTLNRETCPVHNLPARQHTAFMSLHRAPAVSNGYPATR